MASQQKDFIVKNGLQVADKIQLGKSGIEPVIDLIASDESKITLRALDGGVLSFEGENGQLFSIADQNSGTIFSVNDISGIPSIEVSDTGTIKLAEFGGNVLLGGAISDGVSSLQVKGNSLLEGDLTVSGTINATIEGNASTATALQTPRTISISGDAVGSVSFDGTQDVDIALNVADDLYDARYVNLAGDTMTGNLILQGAVTDVQGKLLVSEQIHSAGVNGSIEITQNATDRDTLGGSIKIFTKTNNGGKDADAGNIEVSTGASTNRPSGSITISTGTTSGPATPGPINIKAGDSLRPDTNLAYKGGDVNISAGNVSSTGNDLKTGGDIVLTAGENTVDATRSGEIIFNTGSVVSSKFNRVGDLLLSKDLTVTGNLTVNGTTTSVNSSVTTLEDPVITLGGNSDANATTKDRGIEFKYGDGSVIKTGFFGYDRTDSRFKFIPDATNTSETFAGSVGDIEATNFHGSLVGNADTASKLETPRTISISGDASGSVSFDGSADADILLDISNITGDVNVDGALNTSGNLSTSGNLLVKTTTDTGESLQVSGVSSLPTITTNDVNFANTNLSEDASSRFEVNNTNGIVFKSGTSDIVAQITPQLELKVGSVIAKDGSVFSPSLESLNLLSDSATIQLLNSTEANIEDANLNRIRPTNGTDVKVFGDLFVDVSDQSLEMDFTSENFQVATINRVARMVSKPSSPTDVGKVGDFHADPSALSVAVGENQWKELLFADAAQGEFVNTTGDTMTGDLNVQANVIVDGKIGIGTDTPVEILDVAGDARINGVIVGTGDGNSLNNTVVAFLGLVNNTTGIRNTGMGTQSLFKNTTGDSNTSVGFLSLPNNEDGSFNTAVGAYSLFNLAGGTENTAIGNEALQEITTGSRNTSLGGFNGNQNGIDIRESDRNITLSDGFGRVSFWKDSGDNVHLRTVDQNRLSVGSNGLVGIGTETPNNKLSVETTSVRVSDFKAFGTDSAEILVHNSAGAGTLIKANNSGEGAVQSRLTPLQPNRGVAIGTTTDDILTVAANGRVGIGISAPTDELHVAGNSRITGDYIITGKASLRGEDHGVTLFSTGDTVFESGNSTIEKMRLTSDGKLGIGTSSPNYKLHVAGDALVRSDSQQAMFISALDTDQTITADLSIEASGVDPVLHATQNRSLIFKTTSEERMRLSSTGNLLIGTSSNAGDYKLKANGRVRFGELESHTGSRNYAEGFGMFFGTEVEGVTIPQLNNDFGAADRRFDTEFNIIKADNTVQPVGGYGAIFKSGQSHKSITVASSDTVEVIIRNSFLGNHTTYLGSTHPSNNFNCNNAKIEYKLQGDTEYRVAIDLVGENTPFRTARINNSSTPIVEVKYTFSGFTSTLFRISSLWMQSLSGNGANTLFASTSGGEMYGITRYRKSYDIDVATTETISLNNDTGVITCVDLNTTSDISLKDNIETTTGIETILKLRGVEYDLKDSGKHQSGVIAQEVEEVLPHIVSEKDDGTKVVAYQQIIGHLIEAVKDLKAEIEELKANK